jgi:hypothetical protein
MALSGKELNVSSAEGKFPNSRFDFAEAWRERDQRAGRVCGRTSIQIRVIGGGTDALLLGAFSLSFFSFPLSHSHKHIVPQPQTHSAQERSSQQSGCESRLWKL